MCVLGTRYSLCACKVRSVQCVRARHAVFNGKCIIMLTLMSCLGCAHYVIWKLKNKPPTISSSQYTLQWYIVINISSKTYCSVYCTFHCLPALPFLQYEQWTLLSFFQEFFNFLHNFFPFLSVPCCPHLHLVCITISYLIKKCLAPIWASKWIEPWLLQGPPIKHFFQLCYEHFCVQPKLSIVGHS